MALMLVISAAALHAVFGALQKGRHDPWLSRGAIDACYGLMAAPVALFLVPFPEPHMWPIFVGVFFIHTGYKIAQAMAYTRGNYTVVYPVVRGTAPLFTVIAAYIVFGEIFTTVQWVGVLVLLSGIFGLAFFNLLYLTVDRNLLLAALAMAFITGGFVAAYTTYDAFGIRATADPFTFLAWFFLIDGFAMPIMAYLRWCRMPDRPMIAPLIARGVVGGIVAFFSFGSIMLATRLDKVGEAAVLRETSPVFAAAIGWLFLKESIGPWRLILIAMIATGAVIVEFGH